MYDNLRKLSHFLTPLDIFFWLQTLQWFPSSWMSVDLVMAIFNME